MTAPVSEEMTCKKFVELVTDLIEGRLVASVRLDAEAHLDDCHGCTAYLQQMRHTIAGLRALAPTLGVGNSASTANSVSTLPLTP